MASGYGRLLSARRNIVRCRLLLRRFPKLDRIAFGVMNASKATNFRIPLGASFHRDPARRQACYEPIKVINPKVDHPLLSCSSKIVGIFRERTKNCCSCLLLPYGLVQVVNSKMFLVPFGKPYRVGRFEKHTTNSNDLRHAISPLTWEDNAAEGIHMQLQIDQGGLLRRVERTSSLGISISATSQSPPSALLGQDGSQSLLDWRRDQK